MQAREKGLLGIACALLAALALAAPVSAGATVRFASPTGMGPPSTCTTTVTACTLQRAVEDVANNGDEVVVLPGTYTEMADDLMVTGSKHVHGPVGQPVPNVTFTNPVGQGLLLSGTSLLERLSISVTGSSPAALRQNGGTAQQLSVLQQGAGASACFIDGNALLRDSVCWASAANGVGLTALADAQVLSALLRNVTIEATVSPARGLLANADNGGFLGIDAKNTIVRGTTPSADVEATTIAAGSNVTVALERSNYATVIPGGPGTESVTPAGANSNQTAAPAFVNRAAGNFHQLLGSPTVDGGENFSMIGLLDLDGDLRSVGAAAGCLPGLVRPDIGADELVPASRDCVSPDTGIVKGPKSKTRKRRASFEFTSTEIGSFQCSIDEKPFVPCASPNRYRKLKSGKHSFNVRAMDVAGNLDASPAERVWHIRAKRKRRPRK